MKKKTHGIEKSKAIQIAATAVTDRYDKQWKRYLVYVLFDDGSVWLLPQGQLGFEKKQLPNIPLARKIIQISATTADVEDADMDEPFIFALCADGTLWCLSGYDTDEWDWFSLIGGHKTVCPL